MPQGRQQYLIQVSVRGYGDHLFFVHGFPLDKEEAKCAVAQVVTEAGWNGFDWDFTASWELKREGREPFVGFELRRMNVIHVEHFYE
jgi:hypothetical protein